MSKKSENEMSKERIKAEMEELDKKTTMLTQVSLGSLFGGVALVFFGVQLNFGPISIGLGILSIIVGLLTGKKTLSDNKKYKELKEKL